MMRKQGIRSPKLKATEAVEVSICNLVHRRAFGSSSGSGMIPARRESTSAIYLWASRNEPGLLNQLFEVHLAASRERGEIPQDCTRLPSSADERRRMLSAVRATVRRSGSSRHR